jgi:predicted RNA-binding Zn-ribbon protein involved in translation (DUF1610 family)
MIERMQEKPGCLGYIVASIRKLLGLSGQEEVALPYRIRDDFLSTAELSYYQVLKSVLGPKAAISAKVRLADILFVPNANKNVSYFNRISQRHVDFLLCESSTMQPVLVIELDDSSHKKPRQIERDQFLDQTLEAANLPILRVTAKRQYAKDEVISQLTPFFSSSPAPVQSAQMDQGISDSSRETPQATSPTCPKCGGAMIPRVATHGEHKGKQFYGCSNYPKCRGVLPLTVDQQSG